MSEFRIKLNFPNLKTHTIRAMKIWEKEAKQVSKKHYKTGAMRKSIKSFVYPERNGYIGMIGTRGSHLRASYHYPFVIHEGNDDPPTKRVAHPFFDISYENVRLKMEEEIKKGLNIK